MISKQDLLNLLKKEYQTTVRALEAYPEDQNEFKPHERSSDATKLVSTFVFEMYLLGAYLLGDVLDNNKFKDYKPEGVKGAIEDFKKETEEIISRFESLPEEEMSKTLEFAGKTFNKSEYVLMMISDQIHHRGQLTVYIRMAGGKVPSIYGPSADDTSTNL